MDFRDIKNKIRKFYYYSIEYIQHAFFKLILLFLLNFIIIGLYFQNFFNKNFIIFIILFVINLFLIKRLLYKKARLHKVLIIILVIILAFFIAQNFSETIFEKFGFTHFVYTLGGLSDKQILSGTEGMLKTASKEGKEIIKSTSGSITNSKEDSKKAFEYINQQRKENGRKELPWDDKIYDLAKYKVDDMSNRDYFDHPDPDGKCVGSYAKNYGMNYPPSSFADNIFGYDSPTWFDQKEAVDSWMQSRGHRYNLLYNGHIRGAIACNNQYCIFIGQGGSGWVCDTGTSGLSFWRNVGKQPGEI